jgi:hypothetical protein
VEEGEEKAGEEGKAEEEEGLLLIFFQYPENH